MTESPTEPADTGPISAEVRGSSSTNSDPPAEDDAGKASKEAAKYRHQLRATEAERDGLAARLASVQRSQVDAQVTGAGVKPEALWAAGVELEDLLTDDGTVDPAKVSDAIAGARETFGIETGRPYRGIKGMTSGARINVPVKSSWEGAFAPNDRY